MAPALGLAALLASSLPAGAADRLLTLTPRPGVSLRVVVDRPAAPVGSVVLMEGGDGVMNVDDRGNITTGLRDNHLLRTRTAYVKAGYAMFASDVASDQRAKRDYRSSDAYAQDVAAVIAAAREVARPVAIIGTSRGALAVASVLTRQSAAMPDAAVISSGVLLGNDGNMGSASTVGDVRRIGVPVMLLRHGRDTCRVSLPGDADTFKAMLTGAPRVDIVTLDGGGPRSSSTAPCSAEHYHGFYGIDQEAVAVTVSWLAANMRR